MKSTTASLTDNLYNNFFIKKGRPIVYTEQPLCMPYLGWNLGGCDFEACDSRRIEFAPIRWKQDDRLADGRRIQHYATPADVRHAVDFEVGGIVQPIIAGPGRCGLARPAVILGEPREAHPDLTLLHRSALDGAAIKIVLVLVLNLHVAANEFGDSLCGEIHTNPPCLFASDPIATEQNIIAPTFTYVKYGATFLAWICY